MCSTAERVMTQYFESLNIRVVLGASDDDEAVAPVWQVGPMDQLHVIECGSRREVWQWWRGLSEAHEQDHKLADLVVKGCGAGEPLALAARIWACDGQILPLPEMAEGFYREVRDRHSRVEPGWLRRAHAFAICHPHREPLDALIQARLHPSPEMCVQG
jgi:hypothetical protein